MIGLAVFARVVEDEIRDQAFIPYDTQVRLEDSYLDVFILVDDIAKVVVPDFGVGDVVALNDDVRVLA